MPQPPPLQPLPDLKRLAHWGPISVLAIIKLIIICMLNVLGMYLHPQRSIGGAINCGLFILLSISTLYHFLQSMVRGPGYVHNGWKPIKEDDKQHLQYCVICKSYKAPRSHHCRKCGKCVLKMDHHCPWINNCVGYRNHGNFAAFLIFATLGCIQASVILILGVYHSLSLGRYIRSGADAPRVYLPLIPLMVTLLAIGMALGVVLAVGILAFLQIKCILKNQTTIEEWIVEKAVARRNQRDIPPFVFPYDLGWRDNLKCVTECDEMDGYEWPLKNGCGPYDLTMEQIAQKDAKRARTLTYRCVHKYSGRRCPILSYTCAALRPPCSDEPRLAIAPRDVLRVTRRRNYWLYGEKIQQGAGDTTRGPRGWFPNSSVTPIDKQD